MARPYRVEIRVIDDEAQAVRGKRYIVPEGIELNSNKLTPLALWLMNAIDELDTAQSNDEEELV